MELLILAGGMYYLNKSLGHTERDVNYIRNADQPMCPKCFYNTTRQNLPDAGNSRIFESAHLKISSVPEIRKDITNSIFHGNRTLLANQGFNSAILSRQLQVKGDQKTSLGKIPIVFSPWLSESIAKSYVPKILSFDFHQSLPKSK